MSATVTIGVDLGRQRDPTAIAVLESGYPRRGPRDDLPGPGVALQHRLRWLERLPLGTSYVAQVERLGVIADALAGLGRPVLVVDQTGVGAPVIDMIRAELPRLQVRGVVMTAGVATAQTDAYSMRVPKRTLVSTLEVLLSTRRLRVVEGLALADDLAAELSAFTYSLSDSGRDTYEATGRAHDDLVIACALATWFAEAGSRGQGHAFLQAWRSMAAEQGIAI